MALDFLSAGASPSPLRCRLRKCVADKLERLSSVSDHTTRSSASSAHSLDDNFRVSMPTTLSQRARADRRRLGRIEAVRVEHWIRKHDRRHYILHVYQKSMHLPITHRDADYVVETPYAAFFSIRYTILEASERSQTHCGHCSSRAAILRERNDRIVGLSRMLRSTKEKEEGIEKLLHFLLGLAVDAHESGLCEGCDAASHTLAAFLRRPHQPTTGLI